MKFSNPYGIPSAPEAGDAWQTGFCMGFCGPIGVSVTVPVPQPMADRVTEFNRGVTDGQQAAVFGWDVVNPPCMEAREGEPSGKLELGFTVYRGVAEVIIHGAELAAVGTAFLGAVIEMVFTRQGIVDVVPVEATTLPGLGRRVASNLSSRGIVSCAIYMGAASDPLDTGKEICVTPLFRTKAQARSAATSIGRRLWVVMEWRTDMSGSFQIVDGS